MVESEVSNYPLNAKLFTKSEQVEPIRAGFGKGLLKVGQQNGSVVALSADLVESTQVHLFAEQFPDRFIEVGIAEQNLVAVASGLAHAGKIPFISSYAAFSPGRNWEQIKTTVCLNNQPVKIIGSHAGVGVGPDGATHQMLEDIALTRVLPNMIVIAPGDSLEAEKATLAIAFNQKPVYLRLARPKTPVFSTPDSPFGVGKAYVLKEGRDVSLLGTGTMTYHLLASAASLRSRGIDAEVVHVPTIKPLDEAVILASIRKTGRVVTAEEAQIAGGFGGGVAELLSTKLPTPQLRIGVHDRFGESGEPEELFDFFGLSGEKLVKQIEAFCKDTPQYHQ